MSRGKSQKRLPGLSRGKSHREKGSVKLARTKTGKRTLCVKDRVILEYPELIVEQFSDDDYARNLLLLGVNSLKAEIVDMLTMATIMEMNSTNLTHAAVDRFFEWIPLFGVYLERYFIVEEDVLYKWLMDEVGQLKGAIKTSNRMVLKGKIQKDAKDILLMQDELPPNLPAGERIHIVVNAVREFKDTVLSYADLLLSEVAPLVKSHFSRTQVEKLKIKWTKHVIDHVGAEDFLVLYTRWMPQRDMLEWRAKVLLPSDFKFLSYSSWEKDVDYAHFQIAAEFAEALYDELKNDDAAGEEEIRRLQKAARDHHQKKHGGIDEEEYYDDEDGFSYEHATEEIIDDEDP